MRCPCRFVAASVLLLLTSYAANVRADFADYRSIFIDRFDYTYNSGNIPAMAAAIDAQMQNAADEGFTEIIWQVRGRADALYNSNIEPQTSGLTPGFDPLQTALDAAHARGLKLHAWINATPMWNTTALNPPPGHIFHNANPSFRLMDINGTLEPQAGWSNYSSVNPVLPEVHTHINNVVNDIATHYAVDGIHLDYIRYVPGALDFDRLPHDPVAHQMFQQATGLDGSNPANFAQYKNYVQGRITDLVRSIKQTVDAAEVAEGRVMELTASVWRDPDVGENEYIQDYRTWIEEELLDVAMPMIYLSALNDHIYFDANLNNTLNILDYSGSSTRVAPTLASYLHMNPSRGGGVALTISEMERAHAFGAHGVGYYDYTAYFNAYSDADRAAIRDFFASIDEPPPPLPPGKPGNGLDDFEVDEAHFGWAYNTSPVSQTFGLAETTTIERIVTDDAQAGVGSQLLNLVSDGSSTWQLRHNSGIGAVAHPSSNVPLEATGYVGFWLKTNDAGITVQLGLDDPVGGNTAIERGSPLSVAADNQWHLYQWNLEDDAQWLAFAGGANGIIDAVSGTITIDSIWLAGAGDAQIYLDTIAHNPDGPLGAAIPGDYDQNLVVDSADYEAWRAAFGQNVSPTYGADGNGDGVVSAADYTVWRDNLGFSAPGATGSASALRAAVPEPVTLAMFFACVPLLAAVRVARHRR
jgi:uncharacterized lipoprotein YddW (UPF0748 family)